MMANEARQHFTISSSDEQRLPGKGLSRRNVMIWLTVIFLAELLASGITWPRLILGFQAFTSRTSSLTISEQAKVTFYSTGQLGNLNNSQGITDELQINLQKVPTPQPGKSYYAWLLSDNDTIPALFLGTLVVEQAKVNFFYTGPQHTNLLANYNRFLITEETTNITPASPSLDIRNWRYSAAFPTTPNPADTVQHFSVLDHLRHLLAQDPKLKAVGLGGGLDIWLFRNVT
ncbi:MAG TPA: hypothetical protein VEH81_14695, partial [Ktedonobacteraceae bacterium]|nr:hypothetical protein [Ktedonobacteraceae bacterium]